MPMQVLVFAVDNREYAIEASRLAEVVRAVEVTLLPTAPPIVEGVIDVRGVIAPVVDLRARFGHPPRPIHPDQHMIVARARDRLVAFRVDQALQLVAISPDDLAPAESVWRGIPRVAGVARLADGIVVIHDLDAFLSDAESVALDRALERGASPGGHAWA